MARGRGEVLGDPKCCACGGESWVPFQPVPLVECGQCGLRRQTVFPEFVEVEERYREA
jgi:hypothetical protein